MLTTLLWEFKKTLTTSGLQPIRKPLVMSSYWSVVILCHGIIPFIWQLLSRLTHQGTVLAQSFFNILYVGPNPRWVALWNHQMQAVSHCTCCWKLPYICIWSPAHCQNDHKLLEKLKKKLANSTMHPHQTLQALIPHTKVLSGLWSPPSWCTVIVCSQTQGWDLIRPQNSSHTNHHLVQDWHSASQ